MKKLKILLGAVLFIAITTSTSLSVYADTYEYDELNRLIKVTYDSGEIIQYTYDSGGNILKITTNSSEPDKDYYQNQIKTFINDAKQKMDIYEKYPVFTIEDIRDVRDSYEGLRTKAIKEIIKIEEIIAKMESSTDIVIDEKIKEQRSELTIRIINKDTELYNKEMELMLRSAAQKTEEYENCKASTIKDIKIAKAYEGIRSETIREFIKIYNRIDEITNLLYITIDDKYMQILSDLQMRVRTRDEYLNNKEKELLQQ